MSRDHVMIFMCYEGSHDTHVDRSWHTNERVKSHIYSHLRMSRDQIVTHLCVMKAVMTHMWIRYDTHTNESCHVDIATCWKSRDRVMTHMCDTHVCHEGSHNTHVNGSKMTLWCTYNRGMSHIWTHLGRAKRWSDETHGDGSWNTRTSRITRVNKLDTTHTHERVKPPGPCQGGRAWA